MGGCGGGCGCGGEALKLDGKWVCHAEKCPHRLEGGGCKLGKVSLTCNNNECRFNKPIGPGIYGCISMDVHLDAEGKCLLGR